MSSRVREVEHRATCHCEITHESIQYPSEVEGDNESLHASTLAEGTTLRIAPMEYHSGGWTADHFHEKLRLDPSAPRSNGLLVTFEAMARECVAIAFSPTSDFVMGKTYAIHIGAAGNLQTVIRRRLPNGTQAIDVEIATPQICARDRFVSYWVCLQGQGQLSVGIGAVPGKQCLGTLDDSLYHALRSPVDAVRFVGLGNSALGRNARDCKVRRVKCMSVPSGKLNLEVVHYDRSLLQRDEQEKDQALWAEYQKECDKAKARALKYNTEYKAPAPDAFFKWSEARRLRANPDKGFITGMDIMSTEEQEKARKRKQRFEEEEEHERTRQGLSTMDEDDKEEDGNAQSEEQGKDGVRPMIPLEQAWDNEELTRTFRVDPPSSFHIDKNASEGEMADGSGNGDRGDEVGSHTDYNQMIAETGKVVTDVPEKIHLFAIDWAAFKQIRTEDIMAYFSVYGPTYVEWLGELSCNVLFEDKYSAARALDGLSRELPLSPPLVLSEGTEGSSEIQQVENTIQILTDTNDQENSTMVVEGGADDVLQNQDATNSLEDTPSNDPPNLGSMGWRFCNYALWKRQSDRYGRRGTRSRCLVRTATSLDVLEERPTSWPKPPPGFTTKRVLGPGSDFKSRSRRQGGKRRRKSYRGSFEERENGDPYEDDYMKPIESVEDKMSRGLASSR